MLWGIMGCDDGEDAPPKYVVVWQELAAFLRVLSMTVLCSFLHCCGNSQVSC